jgi:N-methylhydantoinase B
VPIPSGSVLHVLSGGGGGWGNPAERDPAARERDAAEGLT